MTIESPDQDSTTTNLRQQQQTPRTPTPSSPDPNGTKGLRSEFTTNFLPPQLPDTNYKTDCNRNVPFWKRFLLEIHFMFCLSLWFGLVLAPAVLGGVLLLRMWKTAALLWGLYAFSFAPKFFPQIFPWATSTGFRSFLFSWFDIADQFTKGFHVHYSHGVLELLAYRNRPADYLIYKDGKPQYTPTALDHILPSDAMTKAHQAKYGIYNNVDNINNFGNIEVVGEIAQKQNLGQNGPTTTPSSSSSSSSSPTTTPRPYNHSNNLNDFYATLPPETLHALNKPLLLAGLPHGIFCTSFYLGGVANRSLDRMNSTIKWCVASNLTQLPFFQYVHWFKRKLWSAAGDDVKGYMTRGEDLALVPGGFHEASLYQWGKYNLYLKKRLGFIAYALRFGYNIVPMFGFGEEECYYNLIPEQPLNAEGGNDNAAIADDDDDKHQKKKSQSRPKPSLTSTIIKFLNDNNIPAILPIGKYFCTSIPINTEKALNVVYGKPLFLPQITDPTDDEVRYWHGVFITRVEELFAEWKDKLGLPETAKLNIY